MKRKTKADDSASHAVPDFQLDEFLPYRLAVAANRVSRMFAHHYAKSFGLTIPEWRVLTVVGKHSTISPSAVGEMTAMDKVKVSRAAAGLVTRGLVKQAQDPNDGRGRLLSLTRKGASVHTGIVPLARELEGNLSEGLNKQEWATLNKALVKLTEHVGGLDGGNADVAVD